MNPCSASVVRERHLRLAHDPLQLAAEAERGGEADGVVRLVRDAARRHRGHDRTTRGRDVGQGGGQVTADDVADRGQRAGRSVHGPRSAASLAGSPDRRERGGPRSVARGRQPVRRPARAEVPSRDRLETCPPPCRTRPPGARRSRRSPTTASCPTARRVALVAPSGNVEWLCLPRLDSPSVFGAMLDRDAGGFRFGPDDVNVPAARRYLPGTMVLETSWGTPTGWIIVRDLLLMGPVAPRGRALQHASPGADRLRRRPRAAAHGALRQRRGAGRPRLRADVRLRPPPGRVGLQRRGLRPGRRPRAAGTTSS